MLTEENIRAGLSPKEAQRAARIELGGIEQVKEQVREERIGNWLRSVISDCRYGLRQLRKNPGVTAIMVSYARAGHRRDHGHFQRCIRRVAAAAAVPRSEPDHGRLRGHLERPGRRASPTRTSTTFAIRTAASRRLRSTPTTSRPFPERRSRRARRSPASRPTFSRSSRSSRSSDGISSAGDAKKGAGPTALVSYGYWRQYLGSPRDLSQSHLKIDGAVFSVIGVLPAGFHFPADVGAVAAGRSGRRKPKPDLAQLQRGRAPARRRDRRAGESRHQRDRPAHSRHVERARRLSPERWHGPPAAGFDHRQGPPGAADPARRGRISAAGGVRERREPAARAGVGRESASSRFAARWARRADG